MRETGFLAVLIVVAVGARRIQLSDSAYPFLATDAGQVLRWSSGELLRAVHEARWIEIAPRGIRVGVSEPLRPLQHDLLRGSQACEVVEDALCAMPDGRMLPSTPPGEPAVVPPLVPFPIVDPWVARMPFLLALLHHEEDYYYALTVNDTAASIAYYRAQGRSVPMTYAMQDACAWGGQGRASSSSSAFRPEYTVTACDVLQGQLVAVFEPATGQLRLLPQSFGPMPYTVGLIMSAVCLYYATVIASSSSASEAQHAHAAGAALWLLGGCILLAAGSPPPPFLTRSDLAHFWAWTATGVLLALGALLSGSPERAAEACIYALGSLADLAYRSPENAYAGLLCALLAVRQWDKALRWRVVVRPGAAFLDALDLCLTTPMLAVTADLAVAPQCAAAAWPIYAGVTVWAAFQVAMHKLRHTTATAPPAPAKA